MPDMLAHYLVAEEAARRLDGGDAARLVADAWDAYTVGAQGPDVFFYSHLLRRRGRPNLAHLTHQHQMSAAFRSMLTWAVALPPGERDVALAFVAGYAAHLCLDAEAHPWVLYWTGDITDGADPEVRARSFRRHGLLEASIDVILSLEQGGGTDWLRKRRLLHLPAPQRRTVAALLNAMLGEVYDVPFSLEQGRSAFRTMERVYGTVSDPRALPSRLLLAAAPLFDRSGIVRSQIYPETPEPVAVSLLLHASQLVLPVRAGRAADNDVQRDLRHGDHRDRPLSRSDRGGGERRHDRRGGRGDDRRPQHADRRGLRRPATAGRVRARPGPHLGRRGAGVTAGRAATSSS